MLAATKDETYIDTEACPKCGSRAESQTSRGYPGEWIYKCPDCGHVDADIEEDIFDWMV